MLGGHCIPLDPFYLSWKASEYGMWTRFIELAGEINTQMPRYVVSRLVEALNEDSKSLKGARVLVLGLSYKANIDDTRESPSFELIELLAEGGARVDYCDPYLPEALPTRKHDLGMRSVPCTAEAFAEFDAVERVAKWRTHPPPGAAKLLGWHVLRGTLSGLRVPSLRYVPRDHIRSGSDAEARWMPE